MIALVLSLILAGGSNPYPGATDAATGQFGPLVAEIELSVVADSPESPSSTKIPPWGEHYRPFPAGEIQGRKILNDGKGGLKWGEFFTLPRAFLFDLKSSQAMEGITRDHKRLAEALEARLHVGPQSWFSRWSFEIGVGGGFVLGVGATVGLLRLVR